MQSMTRRNVLGGVAAAVMAAGPVRAETGKLRISHGYSIGYLPLMVMREQKLIEKHAAEAGLGKAAVEWTIVNGATRPLRRSS